MNMTEENDPTPGQLELAKWMTTANGRKPMVRGKDIKWGGWGVGPWNWRLPWSPVVTIPVPWGIASGHSPDLSRQYAAILRRRAAVATRDRTVLPILTFATGLVLSLLPLAGKPTDSTTVAGVTVYLGLLTIVGIGLIVGGALWGYGRGTCSDWLEEFADAWQQKAEHPPVTGNPGTATAPSNVQ
jgi:hypothetical protein